MLPNREGTAGRGIEPAIERLNPIPGGVRCFFLKITGHAAHLQVKTNPVGARRKTCLLTWRLRHYESS